MYKNKIFTIISNDKVARRTYRMRLEGDTSDITAPGQFVNIELPGKYLRRPISLCDYDDNGMTLLYDVVGEGTEMMSEFSVGEQLDILVGLGNGFNPDREGRRMLLIGGGIGVAPLLRLARDLRKRGKDVTAVLGFNTASDISLADELESEGVKVVVSTADGTAGVRGFVTDAIRANGLTADWFYACGPLPMLKAVCGLPMPGEVSIDARMGCGFGICMCCSLETRSGAKIICKEGPVFDKEELIWK